MAALCRWLCPLWNVLRVVGRILWRWGRIIWVCRVAVSGVAAGGLLLAYTVPGRDLFADLGIALWQWPIFFGLVFVWAGIVHKSARRALQNDDWVPEAQSGNLDAPLPPPRQTARVKTVRDELQQSFWCPAIVIPRLLSLLVFASVGFAVYRVHLNLDPATPGVPEAAQAVKLANIQLAMTVITFSIYVWALWFKAWPFGKMRHLGDTSQAPPLLAGTAPLFASYLSATYTPPTLTVPSSSFDRFWSVARVLALIMLAIAIFNPLSLADWYPRLYFVPLMFGGGVVLLSEIAAWSMRLRTPLLVGIAAVSLLAVFLTQSFHDTRWIDATVPPSVAAGDKKQISIVDAVKRWKEANNCTDKCPRPILIAGAGGASRAGFYTATVVGALIDLGLDPVKNKDFGDIRNRIFALSTVSGSSAGAAVIRAAMLDAAERGTPNKPPCQIAGTGSWFGQPLMAADKNYDPTKNWRDCFQAIMAGDFLSPIFVALAYRDSFPFDIPFTNRPAWSDRAVLLEQAIERRYHRFTADDHSATSCPDRPGPTTPGYAGMCRPFGHHPDAKLAGAWVPIFFINGTSVFSGRRIVVSDVETTSIVDGEEATTSGSSPKAVFMPMAYDLNKLRSLKKSRNPDDQRDQAADKPVEKSNYIRLSTAVTMSARFPVISPQGILRGTDGHVVDQIVDGGYFENDGLATVIDLAKALQRHKLSPVVLRIVNEPGEPEDMSADKTRPPPPEGGERNLFDDYFAIARALVAARSGHEDQFAVSVKELLGDGSLYELGVYDFPTSGSKLPTSQLSVSLQPNPVCRREVKAAANMKQVSMSWWMSQPVQAYLDAQLCHPANWDRLACELRREKKC